MAEVRKTYYDSGQLESETFVINGKLNGPYNEYFENGQ